MNLPNVKSTIVSGLLDLILPHYCCSCGEVGSISCESCKCDITSEHIAGCLFCGRTSLLQGCQNCRTGVERPWCGGEKVGGLENLINLYKCEYASAAHVPLGDI